MKPNPKLESATVARYVAKASNTLWACCGVGILGLVALPAVHRSTGEAAPSPAVELAAAHRARPHVKPSQPKRNDAPTDRSASQTQPTPAPQQPAPAPAVEAAPPGPPPAWTDAEIISALRECVRTLGPVAAEVDLAPPVKEGECGSPSPLILKSVAAGIDRIELKPPVPLNCRMIGSLAKWVETVVQPAARLSLGTTVTRISGSSYSCRNRYNSVAGPISEHAFANAIDITSFGTADGRSIEVVRHWGETAREAAARKSTLAAQQQQKELPAKAPEPAAQSAQAEPQMAEAPKAEAVKPDAKVKPLTRAERRKGRQVAELAEKPSRLGGSVPEAEAPKQADGAKNGGDKQAAAKVESPKPKSPPGELQFLHKVHQGACGVFGTVLGPEANDAHKDHFHLDMRARVRNSVCQ